MWFANPAWLLLLLLSVPVVVWWWRTGSPRRNTVPAVASLLLRLLVVITLSLFASGLRWTYTDTTPQRVIILTDDQPEPVKHAIASINQSPDGLRINSSQWRWPASSSDSNTAQAVSIASAMLPPGSAELWLPQQDAQEMNVSKSRLAAAGVLLNTFGPAPEPSPQLTIETPSNTLPGSEFTATVRFNPANEADQLNLSFDQATTAQTVDLSKDQSDARIQLFAPDQPGLHQLTVALLNADGQTQATTHTDIWIDQPFKIAVVDTLDRPEEAAATAERLSTLWGQSAEVSSLSSNEVNAVALNNYQLLVALSGSNPQTSETLKEAVSRGTGLLMLAAPTGLPPASDPLAEVLPARGRQTMEQRDPSVALVIIIDTSGSMGGARMPIAKQVAEFAIRRLMPHDRVGIVEFYGSRRWAAPLQPASNQIEIRRGLHRLTAGGGTIILPAVDEAHYALLNIRARFKHVLILTDGGVETGPFREKIERMRKSGVTTSTVLVGPAQHSQFLTSLAQWGGGHYYQAPDRFQLPEIVFKQVDEQRHSPFAQTPTRVQLFSASASADDTMTELELTGYQRIDAKPTSHQLATADSGEPLAVWWQFGKGRSAVWAASLTGSASASVFENADAARWMRQWMLSLAAAGNDQRIAINVQPIEQGLACSLQWVGTGHTPAEGAITLQCLDTAGEVISETATDPIGFGRWNARLLTADQGAVTLRAVAQNGAILGQSAAWAGGNTPNLIDDAAPQEAVASASSTAQVSVAWHVVDPSLWLMILAWIGVLGELTFRRFGRNLRDMASHATTLTSKAAAMLLLLLLVGATNVNAATPNDQAGLQVSQQAVQDAQELLADAIRNGADVDAQVQALADKGQYQLALALADEAGLSQRCIEVGQAAREAGKAGAVELVTLSRHLEAYGRLDEAKQALQQAIALAPESQQTGLRLRLNALSILPKDKATEADGLPVEPTDDVTKRWLGHYTALLGQPEKAAQRLSAIESPNVLDLLSLSEQYRQLGRTDEARAVLEKAEQIATRSSERSTIALVQFRLAIESDDELALAERWLNEKPIPAPRFWPLMTLLRRTDQTQEAVRLAAEAAAPDKQAAPEFDAAMLRRELLSVAMDSSAGDAAVAALRNLVEQDGHSVWGACLGQVLMLRGDKQGAALAFNQAVDLAKSATEILWCADAADEVGAYDLALRIAEQAEKRGGGSAFDARLWQASHLAQRGRIDDAIEILTNTSEFAEDAADVRRLSEAYAEIGRIDVAIDYLHQWLDQNGGPLEHESLTAYLSWLLTQQGRNAEAITLWRQLWEDGGTAAMRQRAQQQMLELSARLGNLGTLAIEMEQRISDDATDEAALGMLIDLYLRIDDPISAAELLLATNDTAGDQLKAKQRLAQLYLRTGRLGLADSVLAELITLDPDGAVDYWQQRAVLAAERGDLTAAKIAIDAMKKTEELPAAYFNELSAGVHAMLGDNKTAADQYRLTLLNNEEHVELWLLWGQSMQEARHTEQATARLLRIVERAEEDDLFLVGVDGLLNLDASQAMLEAALRRAMIRAAAYPERGYLLRVAIDLAEALGYRDSAMSWMDPILLADGDRAITLLRESIERATALGLQEEAGTYGQMLVATGQAVPPEVMIGLGDMLLSQNKIEGADRAFQRAVQFGERGSVVPQVAERYERALRPRIASRLLNELLLSMPDDVSLLYRQASIYGQLEQWDRARACYLQAVEVMLNRMPLRAADEPLDNLLTGSRQRVASDISETQSYFGPCVDGLIFAAFDDAAQAEVVEGLTKLAKQAARASQAVVESGDNASRFPRWIYAADALRYASLTTNQYGTSNAIDAQLAATFQADKTLHQRIAVMVREYNPTANLAADMPNQQGEQTSIDLAELSLKRGDLNEAVTRLASALEGESKWPTRSAARAASLAVALDRLDLVAKAVKLGLENAFNQTEPKQVQAAMQQLLPIGWHALSETDQQWVLQQLDTICEKHDDPVLQLMRLRARAWSDDSDALSGEDADRAIELMKQGGEPGFVVAVMNLLSADDAANVIEQAWNDRDEAQRAVLLIEVAAGLSRSPEPALQEVLLGLASKTTNPRLDEFRPYIVLRRGAWTENPAGATLAIALLESLLDEHPDHPAVMTLLAQALHSQGGEQQLDRASQLARSALELLSEETNLTTDQIYTAEDARLLLQPKHVDQWLTELAERRDQGQARINELLMASMAAAGVGMDSPAEQLALEAFTRAPGEPDVRNWVVGFLFDHQRFVTLADLLWPRRGDRAVVQEQTVWRLSEALRQLDAPNKALEIASIDERSLGAIPALPLRAALGQDEGVRMRLLQFFNITRLERRYYSPRLWQKPSPGGVIGYRITPDTGFSDRRTLWEELSPLPFAAQLYEARLRSASADRHDVAGLIDGLADALLHANQADAKSLELTKRAHNGEHLDPVNVRLLLAIAGRLDTPDVSVTAELTAWLGQSNDGPTDDEVAQLIDILPLDTPGWRSALQRWLIARRAISINSSREPVPAIDEPASLTRLLQPSPFAPPSRLLTDVLDGDAFTWPNEQKSQLLAQLEHWLNTTQTDRRSVDLVRLQIRLAASQENWEKVSDGLSTLISMPMIRSLAADAQPLLMDMDKPDAEHLGRLLLEKLMDPAQPIAGGQSNRLALTCLLTTAATEQDLSLLAQASLEAADSLKPQAPATGWLYVIDAADSVNPGLAKQLSIEMAGIGALPPSRLNALMQSDPSLTPDHFKPYSRWREPQ